MPEPREQRHRVVVELATDHPREYQHGMHGYRSPNGYSDIYRALFHNPDHLVTDRNLFNNCM